MVSIGIETLTNMSQMANYLTFSRSENHFNPLTSRSDHLNKKQYGDKTD